MHAGILAARNQAAQQAIASATASLAKEFGFSDAIGSAPYSADPAVKRLFELEDLARFLTSLAAVVASPTQGNAPTGAGVIGGHIDRVESGSDGDASGLPEFDALDDDIRTALIAAGMQNADDLVLSSDEELLTITGIGPKRLAIIREHFPYDGVAEG